MKKKAIPPYFLVCPRCLRNGHKDSKNRHRCYLKCRWCGKVYNWVSNAPIVPRILKVRYRRDWLEGKKIQDYWVDRSKE